jgi:hypothetical protein
MSRKLNISINQKINKLTFLEEDEPRYDGFRKLSMGVFECECGKVKTIMISNVIHNKTKSCGCLYSQKKKVVSKNRPTGLKYKKYVSE